jgi:hypothetical protein
MDQQQHLARSPQQHYEQLLVEFVRNAPTEVQREVAIALGHHASACDSDSQVHNEDLCDAESQRRRAETAEADCEWYKLRADELEQAKHAYADQLAAHRNGLGEHAYRMREQASAIEHTVDGVDDLLTIYGDRGKL